MRMNKITTEHVLQAILLVAAILTTWNWGISDNPSETLWAVLDACFIGLPVLYLIMCKTCRSSGDIQLNSMILVGMVLIAVVTAYQLLNGQFGVTEGTGTVIWNYLDGAVAVFYSYLAGRGLH